MSLNCFNKIGSLTCAVSFQGINFQGKKKKKNLKKDKMRWEQEELFHIINQIKKKTC